MASNYAKRMAFLSARIFGEVARPTNQRSMKVVRMFEEQPLNKNPEITNWYPHHVEMTSLMWTLRQYGLYRFVIKLKNMQSLKKKSTNGKRL